MDIYSGAVHFFFFKKEARDVHENSRTFECNTMFSVATSVPKTRNSVCIFKAMLQAVKLFGTILNCLALNLKPSVKQYLKEEKKTSVKYVVAVSGVKAVRGEERVLKLTPFFFLFFKNPNWNLSKNVELIQIGFNSDTSSALCEKYGSELCCRIAKQRTDDRLRSAILEQSLDSDFPIFVQCSLLICWKREQAQPWCLYTLLRGIKNDVRF